MADFRRLTPDYSVSPQILPGDIAEAAARGFVLLINNRPDDEERGQPAGADIAAAARAAGLGYAHIPVASRPLNEQIEAHRRALADAGGPALAFCRSGTRSTVIWALGRPEPRERLIALAASAGYDLAGVLP